MTVFQMTAVFLCMYSNKKDYATFLPKLSISLPEITTIP